MMQDTNYNNIDPIYSSKHEYAKIKTIDAVRANLLTISLLPLDDMQVKANSTSQYYLLFQWLGKIRN